MNTLFKYVFLDILRTQTAIFSVLMLIFMSQTFIKFISRASKGSIPTELVAQLMSLSIPSMADFMLPLSLFLAVLFSIGSLCSQSEMVVMRSAGFSRQHLLIITFWLIVFSGAINAVCTFGLAPWCEARQLDLIAKAKSDPSMFTLESGRFLKMMNNVVYIENEAPPEMTSVPYPAVKVNNSNIMRQIYIMNESDGAPSVTISQEGYISYDQNDFLWLTLKKGVRYEGPDKKNEFKVLDFDEYKFLVPEGTDRSGESKVNAKSTENLIKDGTLADYAELEWRFVQPFSILVLVLMAVPMAMVNPRQGRFAKFVPAMIIYISYFLFAFGVKAGIARGHFPLFPGIMIVPVAYLLLFTIPFNLTETEWYKRMHAYYVQKKGKRNA